MCFCTLAEPLYWLLCPLLPDREPDPGLDPELGLEPVLPLLLCSHSSCGVERVNERNYGLCFWFSFFLLFAHALRVYILDHCSRYSMSKPAEHGKWKKLDLCCFLILLP